MFRSQITDAKGLKIRKGTSLKKSSDLIKLHRFVEQNLREPIPNSYRDGLPEREKLQKKYCSKANIFIYTYIYMHIYIYIFRLFLGKNVIIRLYGDCTPEKPLRV